MTQPKTTNCVRCGEPLTRIQISARGRFCSHHCAMTDVHARNRADRQAPNPSGLCFCGCGGVTPRAQQSKTAKGLVKGEYARYIPGHYRHSPPDKYVVHPDTGCWEWQGHKVRGYGYLCFKGKTQRAHRYYYAKQFGAIPDGMHIHHRCNNPGCVNPDHLEAVTPAENSRARPVSKLSADDLHEIRSLLSTMSHREIAKRFGVDPSHVSRIASGQRGK